MFFVVSFVTSTDVTVEGISGPKLCFSCLSCYCSMSMLVWTLQALYQVIVLLALNFQGRKLLKLESHPIAYANQVKNTLIFNAFVLCQIFNEFNARKPDEFNVFKGITKNYLFIGIVGVTVVLQVLIIEFLGKFATTVKLNWSQWLISIIIGIISWPLAVLGKLIPVPETPISKFFPRCHRRRRRAPQS
jgi:Ca2+-transporting ATPase